MGKKQTAPTVDAVNPKPNGTIEFVIAGDTYLLGRPTVGQLRSFEEALEAIAAAERDGADVDVIQHDLHDWWRNVFLALGADPLPIDDDDLPPWLSQSSLIVECRTHWRAVPWGPGGSPSNRVMEQATKSLKTLLPAGQGS